MIGALVALALLAACGCGSEPRVASTSGESLRRDVREACDASPASDAPVDGGLALEPSPLATMADASEPDAASYPIMLRWGGKYVFDELPFGWARPSRASSPTWRAEPVAAPSADCRAARGETSTLSSLLERLQEVESRENPDIVTSLDTVRLTAEGHLTLPSLRGDYALTDWSRTQLSKLVGLASWDRWFVNASGSERAEEMNRRLARASGIVRVRSVRHGHEATETEGAVRAIMSPRYTPVSDVAVARTLREALAKVEPEPRLARANVTDLSASYVVKLGKPFRVGDGGQVGDVWGGLMVRHSGVGFTRLSISLSLVRLICLNGMAAPVPDGALVRSVHRGLDLERVREQIAVGLDGVAEKLHRGAQVLEASTGHHVEDAEREVRGLLRRARLPVGLARDIMDAYAKEPKQSRFGVSQALTLAAQRVSPEVRYDLERLAGQYLAEAS